jgi:hypothetical protein
MTQPSLAELLARLKGGVAVPIPEGGENAEAYHERIFTSGLKTEVTEEQYFYWLEILPPRWMRGSHFCFAEGEAPFCLFWHDREARRYFPGSLAAGRRFTSARSPELLRRLSPRPTTNSRTKTSERRIQPMSDSLIGYGAFPLEDLVPGEEFFAQDGTPGKVADEQRRLPDHVDVFLGEQAETLRLVRPPTMRVFGTSLEQARRIARRVAQRRRRAQEKGGRP